MEVRVGTNQGTDAQYIFAIDFTSEGGNYNFLVYFYRKLYAHTSQCIKKLKPDAPYRDVEGFVERAIELRET